MYITTHLRTADDFFFSHRLYTPLAYVQHDFVQMISSTHAFIHGISDLWPSHTKVWSDKISCYNAMSIQILLSATARGLACTRCGLGDEPHRILLRSLHSRESLPLPLFSYYSFAFYEYVHILCKLCIYMLTHMHASRKVNINVRVVRATELNVSRGGRELSALDDVRSHTAPRSKNVPPL